MISKETIDKVFELARVEEVIADFVVLKKSGANYKGLSPFTNEKTPSFVVSPAKQIWKDFSSGKGGNVIAFLKYLISYKDIHYNYIHRSLGLLKIVLLAFAIAFDARCLAQLGL